MNARWIWYPGDFELYHSMLLHSRRTEYDHDYPAMWHISRPEYSVRFLKQVDLKEPLEVMIHARGKGFVRVERKFLGGVNQIVTFRPVRGGGGGAQYRDFPGHLLRCT